MSKTSYTYDEDDELITFSVDGEKLTEWVCEDYPEDCMDEFNMIFDAGRESLVSSIKELIDKSPKNFFNYPVISSIELQKLIEGE